MYLTNNDMATGRKTMRKAIRVNWKNSGRCYEEKN